MTKQTYKAVLSIAGFDGSGGAGLQADLKTFSAIGCYGMTVLTSLPVQNTRGVRSILDIPATCVEEQILAIFDDIPPDAIKVGMLHREEIILKVASCLKDSRIPLVLDPVMVAKSGHLLLLQEAIDAMKQVLFPHVTVLTPNLPEASALLGRNIVTKSDMEQAAMDLASFGPRAVVIKGGHLTGDSDDCLYMKGEGDTFFWLKQARIPTINTHGTGCTFSSAIAAYLAKGCSLVEAVQFAKAYLTKAIFEGAKYAIGKGNGPVHHFHSVWQAV